MDVVHCEPKEVPFWALLFVHPKDFVLISGLEGVKFVACKEPSELRVANLTPHCTSILAGYTCLLTFGALRFA